MTLPVNVGNPDEHTIKEFATIIKDLTNSQSKVVNLPPTEDDPQRRRPDISRAKKEFDWEPKMGLTEGNDRNGRYRIVTVSQLIRDVPSSVV